VYNVLVARISVDAHPSLYYWSDLMSIRSGELFAIAHGKKCKGSFECHWCASPCEHKWPHNDLIIPFVRSSSFAQRPANSFICEGCYLYQRPSITVISLSGKYKDRSSLTNNSWLLTSENVRIITSEDEDTQALYKILLNPPHVFALSLASTFNDKKTHLHCAHVNELSAVKADTAIKYTLDNKVQSYTVYELEEALKHGSEGKMPGVRLLVDMLGPYEGIQSNEMIEEVKRGKGRPKKEIEGNPVSSIFPQ